MSASRGLHWALWGVQLLLGLFFIMVGYSHGLMPFDEIAAQAVWMTQVPRALARFIGYAELAGGVGLILPAATRITPWLTPLAALGVATIMLLALLFHLARGEASVVWIHALVASASLFVAWGRWRKAPIPERGGAGR
jgi:putative oxidoreductase